MSEYQYYEFLAVDRPLSVEDQRALRTISSRARITATSFTNHYEWGNLKADPTRLLLRFFDLHVYVAMWGTKRLLIRLPGTALSLADLDVFQLDECDLLEVRQTPDGWLIDIDVEGDEEAAWDEFDDGSGWMGTLAGLRQELLSGDLRLFYLCWLWSVQAGHIREEVLEPLPGIGPLTSSQHALAEFMALDPMLVEAAAESGERAPTGSEVEGFVVTLPLHEKNALLRRLLEGDGSVTAELQRRLRQYGQADQPPRRSVAELKIQAGRLSRATSPGLFEGKGTPASGAGGGRREAAPGANGPGGQVGRASLGGSAEPDWPSAAQGLRVGRQSAGRPA
ncbi:MAG: hypothetical protein U5L98_09040 [Halomonas sp.]|uniref:hypothetical protein n=1 Tax=Halomonas sp. TaxID=1486246 RepID=UPI002ACD8F94|nr:hypothetical protein [Halomonas sp.]MDZ7852769.1 hypothetical protein [Halomonas sp.]